MEFIFLQGTKKENMFERFKIMNEKPIRILHDNVFMDQGGIETQLMRVYRAIDKSKIQFDFLLHRTFKGAYDDEIREMGGRIFYAEPYNPFHYLKYIKSMENFFEGHPEYKIMISHSELALGPLMVAKRAGIPVRICYSHNARFAFNLKRCFVDFETLFLKKYCTDMFAVSEKAARYTFGNEAVNNDNVKLIKNGIIVEDFIFNRRIRENMRDSLGLSDKFIVGHVGRFMQQKNHIFLLEVFAKLLRFRSDAHLILVGDGRLENRIIDKARKLGIDNNITLLGRRTDVNDLMKAMDVFLLPSLWEGFPNVAIEAQASALDVFMSENITEEADFSKYSHRLPLDKGADYWANVIYKNSLKNNERIDMSYEMKKQGYDVRETAKWYESFYEEMYRRVTS